jgi:hypothetical protein
MRYLPSGGSQVQSRLVVVCVVAAVLLLGALAFLVQPPAFDQLAPYRQANGTIRLTGADYNAIKQYLSPPATPRTVISYVQVRDAFGMVDVQAKEIPNPAYHNTTATEQSAQPGLLSGIFAGPAPDVLGMLRGAVTSFLSLFTFNAAASSCNDTGECYWVGGSSSDWSDGNNWASTSGGTNVGAVPTSTSSVYFDSNSGTGTVSLTAAVTVASLDMAGYGGTLDTTTNNYSLTINGNFTISGTFKANSSAISVSGDWIDSGTFLRGQAQVTLSGSGVTISETNGFCNLTISGTVTMVTDLNVSNTLATSGSGVLTTGGNSITGGAALSLVGTGGLTASTSTLTFGDVTVGSGTTFSLTSGSVSVSGNWSGSGTFTSGTSTVTLSGTSKAVSEANRFYNLTVSGTITAGSMISASHTVIITGTFTVTGYRIQFNALTDSTGTIVSGSVSVTNFTITDSNTTNRITITAWTAWTTDTEYKWTDTRTESTATVTYRITGVTNGKAWATMRDGSANVSGTVGGGSFSFMVTGDTSAHTWDTVITPPLPPATGATGGPGLPSWFWPLVVIGIAVVVAVAVMLFRGRKPTPEPSPPEAPPS